MVRCRFHAADRKTSRNTRSIAALYGSQPTVQGIKLLGDLKLGQYIKVKKGHTNASGRELTVMGIDSSQDQLFGTDHGLHCGTFHPLFMRWIALTRILSQGALLNYVMMYITNFVLSFFAH